MFLYYLSILIKITLYEKIVYSYNANNANNTLLIIYYSKFTGKKKFSRKSADITFLLSVIL